MRTFAGPAALLAILAASAVAWADEPAGEPFELDEFWGIGIGEHRLDGATEVVGWRLNASWYVGQREEKGAEDGLSLIWQGDNDQVSFSLDGVRYVRRF